MERAEVAVVGGGPAGASAGEAAAAAGADTVIFEKGVPREDREGPGPDSTDAAGFLDYWVDLAGLDPTEIPDGVIHRPLEGAEFVGPSERVSFSGRTGMGGGYPHFGFTFHRAQFDDWLRGRAEDAGAEYRVGTAVDEVDPDPSGEAHRLVLADGREVAAGYLVLADGPQRPVTLPTLDTLLPDGRSAADHLGPTSANHIAYQEYRRFPEEVFEPRTLRFWWGWMPGHTAYPWVFPNDGRVARVGLTMPIDLDLDDVSDPDAYRLLRADDDRIPQGSVYVRRLLAEAYPEYDPEDFPRVEDRGKAGGTETYPISSTRPVDSPVGAGVAVVGGAMGATSAFHEGGDHLAIRTGRLAGRLAAEGRLDEYNGAWKDAVGDEVLRNAALATTVEGFGPDEWDRTFATANRLQSATPGLGPRLRHLPSWLRAAGRTGLVLGATYRWRRFRLAGDYVRIAEDEYAYGRTGPG